MKVFLLVSLFVTLLRGVRAFWRLECDGSVALARLDPLMAFGEVSPHVHSVKGGSGFSDTTNNAALLNSKCSSCGVEQDLSAYWAPAMYFMHDDGSVEVVPEKPPHKSYYLMRTGLTASGHQQTVEAFPSGFQMIAGNNFNRNSSLPNPDPNPLGPWPDESQEQRAERAIGFNCLHYAAGNDEPSLMRHALPSKDFLDEYCTDGIRLELFFPSCWNGKLDSPPLHKSHMAYPDGVMVGNCPKGYDRRLVSLFYETIVATDQFNGKPGKFVLANGDPTGYGYHGDFIAAWKGDTLDQAIKTCDLQDSSGDMRDCPVFTINQNGADCQLEAPLPSAIQHEDVKGPMQGLANGLGVYYGPAPAPNPAAGQPPPVKQGPASPPDRDQNLVPTAKFSSLNAPPGTTLPYEPNMAAAHEKIALKHASTSSSSSTSPSSLSRTHTTTEIVLVSPSPPPPANAASQKDKDMKPSFASSVSKSSSPMPARPAADEGQETPYLVQTLTETLTKTTIKTVTITRTKDSSSGGETTHPGPQVELEEVEIKEKVIVEEIVEFVAPPPLPPSLGHPPQARALGLEPLSEREVDVQARVDHSTTRTRAETGTEGGRRRHLHSHQRRQHHQYQYQYGGKQHHHRGMLDVDVDVEK